MTSFSFSGFKPPRLSLFVVPCPMNSQPRFFISSMALGKVSHTAEFKATVALTPAASSTSAMRQAHAHAILSPGVIDDVRHAVRWIRRNAGADRRIIMPDLHVGRDPDRKRLV